MKHARAVTALISVTVMGLAVVAGAPAASATGSKTYTVQVDAMPPVGEPWAFLRFFPGPAIDVHQGDVLNFAWAGTDTPHTATLVPSADPEGWRAVNQAPGGPYQQNILDTAVGGDDNEPIFNPSIVFPSNPTCGTSGNPCSFDGSGVVSSGMQFSAPGAEPSFDAKIDAPVGTYSFVCLLHPGMESVLNVLPAETYAPGPKAVSKRVATQVHTAVTVDAPVADAQAQAVGSKPIWGGRTKYLLSAGGFDNGASANEYSDVPIHVKRGDRITFTGTGEIHTATFPASAAATVPFVVTQCEVPGPDIPAASPFDCSDPSKFQVAVNVQAIAPTPGNELTDPSTFVNSGLLAGPVRHTFIAKKKGTYTFVCLVHGPEMSSTIVVK